jgi:hypothetical protein
MQLLRTLVLPSALRKTRRSTTLLGMVAVPRSQLRHAQTREGESMRKISVFLAALGLFAGACGGGDSAGDSNTCEGLADQAIGLFQDVVDEIDGMSVEEITASNGNFASLDALTEEMTSLQDQAEAIGCSNTDMEQLLVDRLDSLTAETQFGDLMISQLKEQGIGSG